MTPYWEYYFQQSCHALRGTKSYEKGHARARASSTG
jgi:hypothetical protein